MPENTYPPSRAPEEKASDDALALQEPSEVALSIVMAQEGSEHLTALQASFLSVFMRLGVIEHAAATVGCTASMHYMALGRNEHYQRIFEGIRGRVYQMFVDKAFQRAMEGKRKYKFDRNGDAILFPAGHPEEGKPYYEVEHNEILNIFLMKALGGLRETSTVHHEHSGAVGVTVQFFLPSDTTPPPVIEATSIRATDSQSDAVEGTTDDE